MDDLLTTKEAASLLTISVGTLRNWRYLGRGPASFKVAAGVRYRRIELERWLQEQEALTRRGDGPSRAA